MPSRTDRRSTLQTPKLRVLPSLLAADFSRLAQQVEIVERAGAEALHLDVMDGHFVPNISFGVPIIASLRRSTDLFFDAHLMITNPGKYAEPMAKAGCDLITFHIEVAKDPIALVSQIQSHGVRVGVALNPTTPASSVASILESVDLVLIMSVWPGFGGQAFIPNVLEKIAEIRKMLRADQRLEIDGGINRVTIVDGVRAGADTVVAGSSVFGAPDPAQAWRDLTDTAQAALDEGQ